MYHTFTIDLGNNDTDTRRRANSGFVSFWEEQAKQLSWFQTWRQTLDWTPPFARWFVGGKINASYNALDVHQKTKAAKPAILWEGENGDSRIITYEQLWIKVQKFANVLKSLGVKKKDRVTIYLPMIPEIIIAMLSCARIGAVHTVIFSGFSVLSLKERISNSGSKIIITADGGFRHGKTIQLKKIIDDATSGMDFLKHVIVVERTGDSFIMRPKDKLWNKLMQNAPAICLPEHLNSTDPLYILYTSGTTGKPKGVLHGIGGYLTHVYSTFKWAFDIKDSDIYFCTADIGWVTGHSYIAYGPLLHGATQIMYEGALDYPDVSRVWQILEKYKASIFYTTPTAIRMFVKHGNKIPNSFNLNALRLLGTVGEPINPKVWNWYFDIIGKKRCPIIDTWWQTETGGMMISSLPGLETIPLKPGSATKPIPGVLISIVDENGNDVPPDTKGYLVVKNPWPGMLLSLWKDDIKYKSAYWSRFANYYYTGDYATCDSDGYFWLLGRADDILKVAGHRIGTAELESCIVSHNSVAESAVCGIADEIKGEVIIAFIVLKDDIIKKHVLLRKEITMKIRNEIGPIATPARIYFVPRLPKTRSGKIMRRLLKNIAKNSSIGDVSTLEDTDIVKEIQNASNMTKESLEKN